MKIQNNKARWVKLGNNYPQTLRSQLTFKRYLNPPPQPIHDSSVKCIVMSIYMTLLLNILKQVRIKARQMGPKCKRKLRQSVSSQATAKLNHDHTSILWFGWLWRKDFFKKEHHTAPNRKIDASAIGVWSWVYIGYWIKLSVSNLLQNKPWEQLNFERHFQHTQPKTILVGHGLFRRTDLVSVLNHRLQIQLITLE